MVAYFHKLNYVFEILLYMIIENKMHVVEIFVKEGKFFHWQEKNNYGRWCIFIQTYMKR